MSYRYSKKRWMLPNSAVALPNLTLPPFTIYTVDAARLDELPFPAPRKIAYFYAQVASSKTTSHGLRQNLSRKAQPAVEPSEYDACSPNSMTRSLSAMIFFVSCARFSRRSIRSH
jgi:hypothetical protein